MKLLTALCLLACITLPTNALAATQGDGYVLRDTTSLPPPAKGKARLVVARDMTTISESLKPELVFVDRAPVGLLPQRSAVTREVSAGMHRVWLGRGAGAEVWIDFAPGGRYLLRLRETIESGSWRGDLVRDNADGYLQFALGQHLQLAVMDKQGTATLQRNLPPKNRKTQKADSTARVQATKRAALPIVIKEAWYQPSPSDAPSMNWQSNPGTLRLDAKSLRFTREDSLVVEIPRDSIADLRFDGMRGNLPNPWVKIGFGQAGGPQGATFASASSSNAHENYNRLFHELAKRGVGR